MFEKQKNFENKERVKDYISKTKLIFMRHDKKEKDGETIFQYNEDINKDVLLRIAESNKV